MTYTKITKGLAVLLVVCMLAVMLPMFSFASMPRGEYDATYDVALDAAFDAKLSSADNLAKGASVSSLNGAHSDTYWLWDLSKLTDGSTNYVYQIDAGQYQVGNGGFHTTPGLGTSNHQEQITVDLGTAKAFNTVEIYPCRDSDGICHGMPNTFTVEVSVDNANWMTVATFGGIEYAFGEYEPVIAKFDEVTAQYVRVNGLRLNKDVNNAYYMKLSEIAVFNRDDAYCPNYALDATMSSSAAHNDGSWNPAYINDGNRYNLNLSDERNFCQYIGWHTGTGVPADQDAWIAFDLKEVKKVDRVVIWPATQRYGANQNGEAELALPTTISVQTSADGNEWSELTRLAEMPTSYQAITLDFTATETQYIRVYMTRTAHVKLSEIEVFDTTMSVTDGEEVIVEVKDQNLAIGAMPVYSGVTNATNWSPANLNNGVIEASGGFTSEMNPTRAYAGLKFTNKTTLNKLVLYSASLGDADVGVWSGLPKTYTVQYTPDGGLSWHTVAAGTNATVPVGQEPMTISFDTIVATEIRVYAEELYEKASDYNHKYLQLAEMEAWYTDESTELTAGDPISAYLQTRAAKDKDGNVVAGHSDLRVILVGDLETLATVGSATVTVTFELEGETVKTLTKQLGGADNDYIFYKSITAGGEVYTAAEGSAIFGNIITDIPDGAYSDITLTVVDNADPTNILYSGSTN